MNQLDEVIATWVGREHFNKPGNHRLVHVQRLRMDAELNMRSGDDYRFADRMTVELRADCQCRHIVDVFLEVFPQEFRDMLEGVATVALQRGKGAPRR